MAPKDRVPISKRTKRCRRLNLESILMPWERGSGSGSRGIQIVVQGAGSDGDHNQSNPSPPRVTSNRISSPPPAANKEVSNNAPPPADNNEVSSNASPSPANNEMSDDAPPEDVESQIKNKRGRTKMRSLVLTPSQRVEIEFNDRGQPIGLHSTWLSSYLGVLARDLVPVTIDDWRRVSQTLKDDLWTCVKARFKLDDVYKKLFIKVMGHRWKENKSRLVTALRAASKCADKEAKYAILKPDNLRSTQEWIEFIRKKLSKEFQVKSNKFKEIRGKNQCVYTKSRKGYARLEDEMKKDSPMPSTIRREDVWCKAHLKKNGEVPNAFVADCVSKIQEFKSTQTSREPLPIGKDALTHVFGPERNGTVRGVGFGVTPTQMGVHMNNSKAVHELQDKVSYLTNELKDIRKLLMQGVGSKHDDNENTTSPQDKTPQSQNASTNFNASTNVGGVRRKCSTNFNASTNVEYVPRKCKLLNWQKMVVAEGTVASTDPKALAHHIPLGSGVWKIWVEVPLDPNASLWRTTSECTTIGQAVGTTVAWHKDFISLD